MLEDGAQHRRIRQERQNPPATTAVLAHQHIDLEHSLHQLRPPVAATRPVLPSLFPFLLKYRMLIPARNPVTPDVRQCAGATIRWSMMRST